MATLFPTNPTPNQTVVIGSVTYNWNGYAWVRPAISGGVISAVITATQQLFVSTSTNSTSTTSGAVVVTGGVGIGRDLNVGGSITQQGRSILTTSSLGTYVLPGVDISIVANTSTGVLTINNTSTLQSLTVRGATTNQALYISNTTTSVSTITGALVVTGGVGIGGRLNAESIKIADTVFDSTLVSINTTATVVVDTYSVLEFRAAKYLIQIDDDTGPGAKFQVIEILLLVDNIGTVFATEYGVLTTNGELGVFAADVQSNTVRLYFTPYMASNKVISVMRTEMAT